MATKAAEALSCDPGHTRRALAALHDSTLIYVASWDRCIVGGPWVAVYAWCGTDMKQAALHPRNAMRLAA